MPNGPRISREREGWRGVCRSEATPCRRRDTQARRLHTLVSQRAPECHWPGLDLLRQQTELLIEFQEIWNKPLFDDLVLSDSEDRHLGYVYLTARGLIALKTPLIGAG